MHVMYMQLLFKANKQVIKTSVCHIVMLYIWFFCCLHIVKEAFVYMEIRLFSMNGYFRTPGGQASFKINLVTKPSVTQYRKINGHGMDTIFPLIPRFMSSGFKA